MVPGSYKCLMLLCRINPGFRAAKILSFYCVFPKLFPPQDRYTQIALWYFCFFFDKMFGYFLFHLSLSSKSFVKNIIFRLPVFHSKD